MNYDRGDRDWLRHHGIAPYDEAEVERARQLVLQIVTAATEASRTIADACQKALPAFVAFADALIEADVEIDCEAATLLDAGVLGELGDTPGDQP